MGTHVEPIMLYSSASQLAKWIVLAGRQPISIMEPNIRASSSIMAVPAMGSTAPYVHASRWFPITSALLDCSYPSIVARTTRNR